MECCYFEERIENNFVESKRIKFILDKKKVIGKKQSLSCVTLTQTSQRLKITKLNY